MYIETSFFLPKMHNLKCDTNFKYLKFKLLIAIIIIKLSSLTMYFLI